jgi:uracil-DNA glycosylase
MALTADRINREDVSSLISWWRDAGVDCAVCEEPVNWLTLGEGLRSPQVAMKDGETGRPREAVRIVPVVTEALPATLPLFVEWLATSSTIADAGPAARRVAPSGDPASGFMIMLDMPEIGDSDAGHLLSGDIAELVDKMLDAIGRDRGSVYIASLCPGRTPSGRISPDAFDQLAEIARHHVGLVAPEKLWLMGDAASRAILGVSQMNARGSLHVVNQDGGKTVAIASAHPRILLQTPKRKAEVWADMQRLMKGNEA